MPDRSVTAVPGQLEPLLASAFPTRAVQSMVVLHGGSSNRNFLVRLQGEASAFVLRVYVRNPAAAAPEAGLLRSLRGLVPVPELVHAVTTGSEAGDNWILYRYLEGVTFQELKKEGSPRDLAEAAYALGSTLARVGQTCAGQAGIESGNAHGLAARLEILESRLNRELLRQRLGSSAFRSLRSFFRTWSPRLSELSQARCLVHGDFNNRNAIFRRASAGWEVTGILDWELACIGSPLWDAARFLCYERAGAPCREPHFSGGFRVHGGEIPRDWAVFSRVINIASAAEALSRADVPPPFVEDLCRVVRDGLRQHKPWY